MPNQLFLTTILTIIIFSPTNTFALYPDTPNCTLAYPGIFTEEVDQERFVIVQCGTFQPPDGSLDINALER